MDIAILDDLETDREQLNTIISDYLTAKNIEAKIHLFETGKSLLDAFSKASFDLVFLDIKMYGISGMEVAHRLRKTNSRTPIVFITVEKEYALEGYEVHAVDYMVKPFNRNRIFKVMDYILSEQQLPASIYIKEKRMNRQIILNDILFAEMHGHFLEIHTINGICRTYMTFEEFSRCIPNQQRFQKCYRGIIVNLDRVSQLDDYGFVFENGEHVPVSRAKRTEMRNAYASYAFEKTRKGIII